MAITVQNHHVEQFKGNVTHLAQQMQSRLRGTVTSEMVTGALHNFERMGATDAVEKTSRNAATPNIEVPHDRRQVVLREFQWASLIDRGDQVKVLIDIAGKYAQNASAAMGRSWDDLIIAAALGDATSKVPSGTVGVNTLSTVALPASQTVAVGTGGDSTMNIGKLLATKEQLLSADIDEYQEQITFVLNSKQLHELLNDTKITSADYNTVRALVSGSLDEFMGMKFIRSERITDDATNYSAIAYCTSGIGLAIGRDVTARASERDDLSYSNQIYLEYVAEATRIEEAKVMEILTVM